VDGGVTADTIRRVDEAGANMFVSGSHIMKAEHPARAMEGLIRLIGGEVDGNCARSCTDG
jgi:pentose-5-phosphate-3-epimerase